MKFDEYKEVHEAKPMKGPKKYKCFVFFYEVIPIDEHVVNQVANQEQVSVIAKSHTMNVELHSGTKLQSSVEL